MTTWLFIPAANLGQDEMMYSYWSQVTDPDNSVATALNSLPMQAVSSTLPDPKWNTTVLTGDLVQAVAGLTARDGRDWFSSASLPVPRLQADR